MAELTKVLQNSGPIEPDLYGIVETLDLRVCGGRKIFVELETVEDC